MERHHRFLGIDNVKSFWLIWSFVIINRINQMDKDQKVNSAVLVVVYFVNHKLELKSRGVEELMRKINQ